VFLDTSFIFWNTMPRYILGTAVAVNLDYDLLQVNLSVCCDLQRNSLEDVSSVWAALKCSERRYKMCLKTKLCASRTLWSHSCLGDKLEGLRLSTCSVTRSAIQETRMKCLLCTLMRLVLYTWALLCVLFEGALTAPYRPSGRRSWNPNESSGN
jgi:hypothetical protein